MDRLTPEERFGSIDIRELLLYKQIVDSGVCLYCTMYGVSLKPTCLSPQNCRLGRDSRDINSELDRRKDWLGDVNDKNSN